MEKLFSQIFRGFCDFSISVGRTGAGMPNYLFTGITFDGFVAESCPHMSINFEYFGLQNETGNSASLLKEDGLSFRGCDFSTAQP